MSHAQEMPVNKDLATGLNVNLNTGTTSQKGIATGTLFLASGVEIVATSTLTLFVTDNIRLIRKDDIRVLNKTHEAADGTKGFDGTYMLLEGIAAARRNREEEGQ